MDFRSTGFIVAADVPVKLLPDGAPVRFRCDIRKDGTRDLMRSCD